LKKFEFYFDEHYLKRIYEEVKFFSGENAKVIKILTPHELEEMTNRVILDFKSTNIEYFKKEDRVSMELDIKNIQTLYVKTFEFNTLSYYMKNMKSLSTDINLDGLIASDE
jgi:hypothetical protein